MMLPKRKSNRIASKVLGKGESGSTLITVMLMGATLSVVSAILITNTVFNLDSSAKSVRVGGAYQAAEAGLGDYLAKLADDRTYWSHWVHEAESTRIGGTTATNKSWTDDATPGWTYGATKDNWKTLGDDYEYNIQVTPPAGPVTTVKVVATGRKVDATTGLKAIEAEIRPSSLGNFLMVVDDDLSLDYSSLTTNGGVYLTDAPSGTYDLCHDGVANANMYAEDRFTTGCGTHTGTGVAYDGDGSTGYADIRTQISSPISFGPLLSSLDQITIAAGGPGGIYRTNNNGCDQSSNSYDVTFNGNGTSPGTVTIVKRWTQSDFLLCNDAYSSTETIAMPTAGAMWFDRGVTVHTSVVDGTVSLRSGGNITIDGNITYEAPGNDVLGLVSNGTITVSGDRTINAGLASITGSLNAADGDIIIFNGMMILKDGGGTIFNQAGTFTWDTNLATLPPPFFPSIGETQYKVNTVREIDPRL